jgi:SAM-dependent methyltransferase
MGLSRRVKNKLHEIKGIGILRYIQVQGQRSLLSMLRVIYGFDRWHVDSPLLVRPYRRTVAKMVNGIAPKSVIEVGCGLGALLSLIDAPTRSGYDRDKGAIRAARILNTKRICFVHGSIDKIPANPVDVLIMVNWIHDVSPEMLHKWISRLLPYTRFLMVDAIDKSNPLPYAYKHDFAFLQDTCRLLKIERHQGEGRSFLLFEVL